MATPAQILANRENSQLSTGPRTDAGKATSAMNNLRHGLAARGLIVLPGQESAFQQLEQGLCDFLHPNGALQETIFTRIVESAWNLHRCRLAEAQLYLSTTDPTIDPLLDDANQAKYARIQKYARQSENSMFKSLRELGKLQTEVQYRHKAFPLTEEQLDNAEEFERTPHALSEVCSVQKVTDSISRQKATKRVKAKDADRAFLEMLENFSAPPSLPRRDFQFEADSDENVLAAAA